MKRAARDLLVFLVFVVLTSLMTWPWAAHLRDTCSDPGDPYLVSYLLWWDFHGTFTQPLRLFDANIFFPYRDTLAFSEHCWGVALPFFPLFALGLRPLTVHGIATLLGIALSGYGAFRLGRTLTGSAGAGWVAGIAFGFALYRFGQLPHLPYLFTPWMPLLLEALILFVRKPTRGRAAWLGATFLMNGLTAVHWLILTAIPLLLAGTWLLVRARRETIRPILLRGGIALGVAGILMLPFLLPYQRVREAYGLIRPPEETKFYSAVPADWLAPDARNHLWARLHPEPPRAERALFPGLVVPVLAAIGALAFRRREALDARVTGLLWAGLGFLGSLGLNGFFHRFLFEHLPLFRSLRVPARWAMVANLGLALLAGAGALALAETLKRRQVRAALFMAACALLLVELRAAPLELHRGDPDPDALTRKLVMTPMRGGLVELPTGKLHAYYDAFDFFYDLRAADHGKPLVNATSGFGTREASRIRSLARMRPVPDDLLDLFEAIPVSYVTVREAWLLPEERTTLREFFARAVAAGRLRFVGRFDERLRSDLFAVAKTEPEAAGLPLPWTPSQASAPAPAPGREDASLTGGITATGEEISAHGRLLLAGWARIPGEDLGVTILIDGEERTPAFSRRVPRGDVEKAVPGIGDCSAAGFEAAFDPRPDDGGTHELTVLFRAKDGRYRVYTRERFTWTP